MQTTRRRSTPVLMLLTGLPFGAFWFLWTTFTMPGAPVLARVVGALVTGAVFGVVFGLWVGRQVQAAGPAVRDRSFARARRTGVVPADADLLAWRQALEHQRAQHERQRWSGPLVFVAATALALWLALTDSPYWWFGVALFVGFLVAFLLSTPRVLRRTRTMLAELDRRSAQRIDG
ncbi:hypothetical protein [Curtobacterium aetherium]|uniref:Uncharacterized protein n=1 Tax=Curtobacterium aetherium TaxID=2841594 RepID=A0ACD1E4H9_9MICO|nr:hypothetical protein [Curtobacterium sp. L6-1]QWS33780.1 hypothetical protein KM842_00715 [Curtobacterium sp. L6-1]